MFSSAIWSLIYATVKITGMPWKCNVWSTKFDSWNENTWYLNRNICTKFILSQDITFRNSESYCAEAWKSKAPPSLKVKAAGTPLTFPPRPMSQPIFKVTAWKFSISDSFERVPRSIMCWAMILTSLWLEVRMSNSRASLASDYLDNFYASLPPRFSCQHVLFCFSPNSIFH